jgi:hypothetical protein
VLDYIKARRFLEQPTGENLAPFAFLARGTDEDLRKGPGLTREFPRRGLLAGGQPHDDVPPAAGITGLHLEILRKIVALVEHAQHRDAVVHRSAITRIDRTHGFPAAELLRHLGLDRARLGWRFRARDQRANQNERKPPAHGQASGLHAS